MPPSLAVDEILVERRGAVAWVTFNRPQARNAFVHGMYSRLVEVCEELANDEAVRVVVFQGAGDQAFVAGSDISQFEGFRTREQALAYEAHVERALAAVETLPKPTIALIRGAATGSGAAISICCDMRIAAENARLGIPISRTLGNAISLRNVARLAQAVGPALTKDILFTARLIDAVEGERRGIFNAVVPLTKIDARVSELAERLASHAPLTLRATKQAVLRVLEAQRQAAGAGDDLVELVYTSEDFREGVAAFLEKRAANWRGR